VGGGRKLFGYPYTDNGGFLVASTAAFHTSFPQFLAAAASILNESGVGIAAIEAQLVHVERSAVRHVDKRLYPSLFLFKGYRSGGEADHSHMEPA
jgi:hypothetical protein